MNYAARREKVLARMEDQSMLVLYSGIASHISADDYYPFQANRHFFYLTGLRREQMILVMVKQGEKVRTTLYIEQADPSMERWTGKMVTVEEAKETTGIDDIRYVDRFDRELNYLVSTTGVTACYFDCYRNAPEDQPHYNLARAQAFAAANPGVTVRNLWPLVTALRMEKDAEEEAAIRCAIDMTDKGLQQVLSRLKPGMREYQVQAEYEYMISIQGAEGPSFQTIAGSGMNGTMLHYITNRDVCQDGTLILLDLGVRNAGYCSDITRTYPVNGKYTDRQRAVYEVVLKANRAVAEAAKPGMTTRQLNDICKQVLAEGCIALGLIKEAGEIGKYYMHGVSHHLGIDVHDVTLPDSVLTPGCVITDEPGLYIDEEAIGIRIEDDLMITEDGAVCLSEQIIRAPDDIERFMAEHH